MNITRGPYSANVDPTHAVGRQQSEFQVIVSKYGMPIYKHVEMDFEEAVRVAKAYIDWELDKETDT
jgi:uncharacterized Zn finger protein